MKPIKLSGNKVVIPLAKLELHPVIDAIVENDICTYFGMAQVCEELAKYEEEQMELSELDGEITDPLLRAVRALREAARQYNAASKACNERS